MKATFKILKEDVTHIEDGEIQSVEITARGKLADEYQVNEVVEIKATFNRLKSGNFEWSKIQNLTMEQAPAKDLSSMHYLHFAALEEAVKHFEEHYGNVSTKYPQLK